MKIQMTLVQSKNESIFFQNPLKTKTNHPNFQDSNSFESLSTKYSEQSRKEEIFKESICSIENPNLTSDIYTIFLQSKVKPSTIRDNYYLKLITKNVMTSTKTKTYNFIFIYDWDDTFLCTTFLKKRGFLNNYQMTPIIKQNFDLAEDYLFIQN